MTRRTLSLAAAPTPPGDANRRPAAPHMPPAKTPRRSRSRPLWDAPRSQAARRAKPAVEALDPRLVLYTATGNLWPSPQLITISFMPDGTYINGSVSNLNAAFNARFGSAAAWQNVILRAAQSWALQTNINFAVVPDNGAAVGSGTRQQGDPGFGDIRIGGYKFGTTALGMAYAPPPANNYSAAGDFFFNTGLAFSNGTGNDLFTIAVHEIGHALGLGHSTVSTAQMYATYNGVKRGLNSDDVLGVRAVYSDGDARSADAYDAASKGGALGTAVDLTPSVSNQAALITGLDITTTGDVDYFKFTVPADSSTTARVQVQSKGLSLLAPVLTVYDARGGTVEASASGLNQYGTTITATLSGVAPGEVYYVKVAGADASAFGTGRYALALNFGAKATPTAASPATAKANGFPLSTGGGIANRADNVVEVSSYNGNAQTDANNLRAIAIDSAGNSVVVWQSQDQDGDGWGVYAQRFDKAGHKIGGEFRVNTTTRGDQTGPAVAVGPLGSFLVTWTGPDGDGTGIFAQAFDLFGNRLGGEFRVNTTTRGDQTNAAPAIDKLGRAVIVWESQNQDGSGSGVYGQMYAPLGLRLGGEFRVNSTTGQDQSRPTVAVDPLVGGFVVAWQGQNQDGSGLGVFAQRFNTLGARVGREFRVNTFTKGDQGRPSAAIDGSGGLVVTWSSVGQDGSGQGVFAQRFDAAGARVGGEFQVNTYTKSDQTSPSVAVDSSGNFVITWMSHGQAGAGWAVYSRQFFRSGMPADAEAQVSSATDNGSQMYPSAAVDSNGHFAVVWTYPRSPGDPKSSVYMQAFATALLADQQGEEHGEEHEPFDHFGPTEVPTPLRDAPAAADAGATAEEGILVGALPGSADAARVAPAAPARPRNRLLEWARVRPRTTVALRARATAPAPKRGEWAREDSATFSGIGVASGPAATIRPSTRWSPPEGAAGRST